MQVRLVVSKWTWINRLDSDSSEDSDSDSDDSEQDDEHYDNESDEDDRAIAMMRDEYLWTDLSRNFEISISWIFADFQ